MDNVAHEINTPTSIISAETETLILQECNPKNCCEELKIIKVGESKEIGDIKIKAVEAYNIKRRRSSGKLWHPKGSGIGFLLTLKGTTIYHAGDTDLIPEMQKLTGHQEKLIALLPVGGRFTMTAEEAAEAAEIIKPSLAIPMHFGSIIGAEDDASEFVELCKERGLKARVLEKE